MKKVISLFMTVLMIFSMFSFIDVATFAAFKAPDGRIITSVKSYELAPGIEEQRIVTNSIAGDHQVKAYVAIADFNDPNVGFLAGYKDYDSSGTWGMQTVRDQMRAASKAKGVKVVAGINADYFDMSTGKPYGALIMDGKEVSSPTGQPHYFAVLKDGTPVIRDSSEGWDDVEYAIGAPLRIVVGGAVVENPDTSTLPRCAIGITANNKVIIYTADGRQAPTSVGETVYATGQMMKALGCVEAVYLDGGGSSTYASQLASESGITVKSKPSDGTERKVSTTALLYYAAPVEETTTTEPVTEAPTTEEPTTEAVETTAPVTEAPTTEETTVPTTEAPTTEAPTTVHTHTEVVVPGKAATCTESGLTDGKKCSVCGEVTVAQAVIPATGHKEVVVAAVKATYTKTGLTEGKKCSECGTVTVKQKKVSKKKLKKVTVSSVKSTKAKQAVVKWKKVTNASGYVVEYSTSKKFTKKTTKKVTIKKGKTVKSTLKKLKSGKKYYVRVKAYRTEGKKTVYGSWSKVKNVKVK